MYQRYSNSDRREEGERADHLTITLAHSEAVTLRFLHTIYQFRAFSGLQIQVQIGRRRRVLSQEFSIISNNWCHEYFERYQKWQPLEFQILSRFKMHRQSIKSVIRCSVCNPYVGLGRHLGCSGWWWLRCGGSCWRSSY